MKRIALISLAVIAALVSCQKEEFVNESQAGNSPVFTASIATDETKTTLSDDSPAKILWESTDKITITDANSHTAVYKLSAGQGTKCGTFEYESGATLAKGSTYTATYGAAPANYQVYSSAGSVPLYMTAPATSSTDGLVFTAQCGVLRVTLTDASHNIMRVEVSDGTNTYSVTSTSPVDISSATKFYLALPAGTYTTLNIYDNNWQMVSKTVTGGELTITAGHVKPAVSSSLSFTDCTTKGFRGTHAVVQLWADGPFWSETNIGADTPEAYGQYFAWGYPEGQTPNGTTFNTAFSTANYPNITMSHLDAAHDMAAANWGTDWSVPTNVDLHNLNLNCTSSFVTSSNVGVIFTGKTSYTSNSIFLPAAGYGDHSSLYKAGDSGHYWSSVPCSNSDYALFISFGNDYVGEGSSVKYQGYSVRPVYTPSVPTPSVLLSGEFSVSATKKVKFTKGNLWCNTTASPVEWHLESSQIAYPTTWSTDHVSHFFWTKTAENSYASSYSDGTCTVTDKFFADGSDADYSLTVDGQSGLYTLSNAEWTYLLSSTSSEGRGDGDSKFKNEVTVNGVAKCLVIAPDGYTGTIASSYTAAEWSIAESSGLVCLPAAGGRYSSSMFSDGSCGYYWSATPHGDSKNLAYILSFSDSDVSPSSILSRNRGYSVRLVYSE